MSVLTRNINGVVRKRCGSDFEEYITQFDLVILFETWLPTNSNYNSDIKGYKSEHLFGNKGFNVNKKDGQAVEFLCILEINLVQKQLL